jgi:crotonobetaine/carnitine-CoA ligase
MIDRNHIAMIQMLLRGFKGLLREEMRQGDALGTLFRTLKRKIPTYKNDRTVGQELHLRAKRHPHKVFIDFKGERRTYGELDARAGRVACAMKELLPNGGSIAIMAGNHPEYLEVFFATQKAALTCVPINRSLKSDGLAHILNNAEVDLIFVDPDLYPAVKGIQKNVPKLRWIIGFERGGEMPKGVEPYSAFLSNAPRSIREGINPEPKGASLILYTSGTTGLPKGVSYRYGEASQIQLMRFFAHANLDENDVYYTCLPLFHANAIIVTVIGSLYTSARVVLAERFSASQFWNELRAHGATVVNTFTSMIPILMKQPSTPFDRFHKMKKVFDSGMPQEYWGPFQERFGVCVIESYGAVDGGGVLLFNMGYAPAGSLGKPLPGTQYKLVDDEGREVGVGASGELVHRLRKGDLKFEYHKNPDASQEKVQEGWVRSGDLLTRDKEGYLYFVGRKSDAIRRRGENISALEVEKAILKHPDVLDCAAFGVPAELGEEEVMVAVIPIDGKTIDPQRLVDFLKDHLQDFAVPRYMEVVSELPKTETHKVIKSVLKAKGVGPHTWDRERNRIRQEVARAS